MAESKISIDKLIEIVSDDGIVRTGVNIFDAKNRLLLSGDYAVSNVTTLLHLKSIGITELSFDPEKNGSIKDKYGEDKLVAYRLYDNPLSPVEPTKSDGAKYSYLNIKLREIHELKQEAKQAYEGAKQNIIKVIDDIKRTGGEFDYELVENSVMDILSFLTRNENTFSYLTREIFSYDDYLYNHCLNVCILGTAVTRRFNEHFSSEINKYLSSLYSENPLEHSQISDTSFLYYLPEDLYDISIGFFLHDVGKVMIPENILNKKGKLSKEEFEVIKSHTLENGIKILNKNMIKSPFINNIVKYHHSALFTNEGRCYPKDRLHIENPAYVKICKLVDIYDAMTSKRSYKNASNPVAVVTDLFHEYAHKDRMLQFILHSFVNTVGIYPPGSMVFLRDGRMAYIIESKGPIVIPFTDTHKTTLTDQQDPIDLSVIEGTEEQLKIDRRKPVISPAEGYNILPSFLKEFIK